MSILQDQVKNSPLGVEMEAELEKIIQGLRAWQHTASRSIKLTDRSKHLSPEEAKFKLTHLLIKQRVEEVTLLPPMFGLYTEERIAILQAQLNNQEESKLY